MQIPADIPPEAREFLEGAGYLDADRLSVGAQAPALALVSLDGGERTPVPHPALPTVLVFGSYT